MSNVWISVDLLKLHWEKSWCVYFFYSFLHPPRVKSNFRRIKMNTFKIKDERNERFMKIPTELMYQKLSSESKLLYMFLLNKMELSRKNANVNKKGEIYVVFSRKEAMKILEFSDKTCTKTFKQLSNAKLIKESRRRGLANIIYIGKIGEKINVEKIDVYKIDDERNEQFIKFPVALLSYKKKEISYESKLLYALLLDRMELSREKGWINEKEEIYMFFERKEVMRIFDISYKTCSKIFKQLSELKLIKEIRRRDDPNIIYIGKIDTEECVNLPVNNLEKKREVIKSRSAQEHRSKNRKIVNFETVSKREKSTILNRKNLRDTKDSKTDVNKTDNLSFYNDKQSGNRQNDLRSFFENKIELIKNSLKQDAFAEHEKLCECNPFIFPMVFKDAMKLVNPQLIKVFEKLCELMIDICGCKNNFKINGEVKPANIVKSAIMKLEPDEIHSVANKILDPDVDIESKRNIRAYIISMLYNEKSLMNQYKYAV